MSAETIKAAIRTLLVANIPELVSVHTEYRTLNPKAQTPQATVYDPECEERRLAGPSGVGLKELNWTIQTHLVQYGTEADVAIYGTDTYGGSMPYNVSFGELLTRVRALYRANPTLANNANTTSSRVLKFGEDQGVFKPPAQFSDDGRMLHQAILTVKCMEVVNA